MIEIDLEPKEHHHFQFLKVRFNYILVYRASAQDLSTALNTREFYQACMLLQLFLGNLYLYPVQKDK